MEPTITSEIVVAHAQCPRKAYKLLCTDTQGAPHEYIAILEEEARMNRENHVKKLVEKNADVVPYSPEGLKKGTPIMREATLVSEDMQAYVDVLTNVEDTPSQKIHHYTLTLIVGTHKISKEQKLQLAFIGYVLSKFQKEKPKYGYIVGSGSKIHKTELETLYKDIWQILRKLRGWTSTRELETPPVILNRHCPLCPFCKECEAKAKEQDHLSLLKSMSEKEITAQNKKGIFTVTQFSYTYRPRRRRKGKDRKPPKYHHSLKALAIRDDKIYVVEQPEVPQSGTLMFLDVEGIPDQDFYYLIGLLITEGESTKAFSFWADNQSEEEKVWREFLATVQGYSEFTLFHYGSYETKFIERMNKKYGNEKNEELIQKIKSRLVNTLSLIYANIYFPTYSNSLKDIGAYLGQKWTEENATGLQSIVWRHRWEVTKESTFKKILLQYNLEDCLVLKKVTETVENITRKDNEDDESNIKLINEIKSNYKFGESNYIFEDLDFVNKCAYFDYQREKIFFRNKKNKKRQKTIDNKILNKFREYRINKTIEISRPKVCHKCGSYIRALKSYKLNKNSLERLENEGLPEDILLNLKNIKDQEYKSKEQLLNSLEDILEENQISRFKSKILKYAFKRDIRHKIILDLKFFNHGVKRWIVKYSTERVRCRSCGRLNFTTNKFRDIRGKYGYQLKIWTVYQIVALRQPRNRIQQNLRHCSAAILKKRS
jgi:predicted RecB family nuclease